MDARLKHSPAIYVTGFMAAGKTTVSHLLADRLGWHFVDLDTEIEAEQQTTIPEIFDTRGEPEFRRIETEVLRRWKRRIEHGLPAVIALGGGSLVQPANLELLENHGISIWLDCSFEIIERRITVSHERPLARDREEFRRLYEQRRPVYSRADFRIDADCEVEQAVEKILALPCWK